MLIQADARRIPLVDGCVQCVVTSPPYWGLRDYGTAAQIGLEHVPDSYVRSLVEVFAELWRVPTRELAEALAIIDSGHSLPQGAPEGERRPPEKGSGR